MNTTELKDAVYQEAQAQGFTATKNDLSAFVDIMFKVITDGLLDDEDNRVLIRNFGTLKVVKRKGRTYTVQGKLVDVGDRYTTVFKPGTQLAEFLDEMTQDELGG